MPALSFVGASCTGHACFFPRPNSGPGSTTVRVNGLSCALTGDLFPVHVCDKSAHPGALAGGSKKVIINGRPAGRVGDRVSCGSVVAMGSGNVIVGG